LEATSIAMISNIKNNSFRLFNGEISLEQCNKIHINEKVDAERMIMLHYLSGSIYNTNFWNFAKNRAGECFKYTLKDKKFNEIIRDLGNNYYERQKYYSFWSIESYKENLKGLGLFDKLVG
jgi:hypothetical protein